MWKNVRLNLSDRQSEPSYDSRRSECLASHHQLRISCYRGDKGPGRRMKNYDLRDVFSPLDADNAMADGKNGQAHPAFYIEFDEKLVSQPVHRPGI